MFLAISKEAAMLVSPGMLSKVKGEKRCVCVLMWGRYFKDNRFDLSWILICERWVSEEVDFSPHMCVLKNLLIFKVLQHFVFSFPLSPHVFSLGNKALELSSTCYPKYMLGCSADPLHLA